VPSFDVVSEVDSQEVRNAVDQANRELLTRFDFKGTKSTFALEGDTVTMTAPSEFQLKQMFDILSARMSGRKIDVRCLDPGAPQVNVGEARQEVAVRQGIDTDLARKIVKMIKSEKLKVQPAIQGDKVRVTGKKRDDLQTVIGLLKDANLGVPLQFENYRD
jgi:uncharacterized protein YajQ (UPF0234 family)